MKRLLSIAFLLAAVTSFAQQKQKSGNPVFPGWYADPEVAAFGKEYWIYPT
jgi:hypothetical protein